jgi:ribonuclease-3
VRRAIKQLYDHLGYAFESEATLEAALTHRSMGGINNERLEFLGDAILNFIVAESVFQSFPEAPEGELTRLRAQIVKGDTLALVAEELELGPFLRLGIGEMKSGGAHRPSILADTLEAIIAAIYLEAGIETAKACIMRWFDSRLKALSADSLSKDPKTALQEWLQARKLPLPTYCVTQIEGIAHEQTFSVQCEVGSLVKITQGKGHSRRRAEQEAARLALEQLLNHGH